MPNTLVHIAIQTVVTKTAVKSSDCIPFAFLGCVIPDIPWISQRLIKYAQFDVDFYVLRAYVVVQSSLFMSLILASACAVLFTRRLYAMLVISAGCLIHLLLDATETKWANGISLLAPIDWQLENWGIVWPEHISVSIITISGTAVFAYFSRRAYLERLSIRLNWRALCGALTLIVIYVWLPTNFIDAPFREDSHYLTTLRMKDTRPGKSIRLDRATVFELNGSWYAKTFADETINLQSFAPTSAGNFSLAGRFSSEHDVIVSEWHRNSVLRDVASIVGLTLLCTWFLLATKESRNRR